MKRVALLIVGGVLWASCAGRGVICGSERIVESSRSSKPEWVMKKVEHSKGRMMFVGARTEAISFEDARTDARMDAVKAIAQLARNEMYADYERARNEMGIPEDNSDVGRVIREAVIAFSETVVKGAKEEEFYWERIEKRLCNPDRLKYYYNFWILLSIPESEFDNAKLGIIEKQIKEAKERNNREALEFLERVREKVLEKRE